MINNGCYFYADTLSEVTHVSKRAFNKLHTCYLYSPNRVVGVSVSSTRAPMDGSRCENYVNRLSWNKIPMIFLV